MKKWPLLKLYVKNRKEQQERTEICKGEIARMMIKKERCIEEMIK